MAVRELVCLLSGESITSSGRTPSRDHGGRLLPCSSHSWVSLGASLDSDLQISMGAAERWFYVCLGEYMVCVATTEAVAMKSQALLACVSPYSGHW